MFTDVGVAPPYKHIPETHVRQHSTGISLSAPQVARVCTLWRDIISSWPIAWRCLAFDLNEDPTPFLEAFNWSRDLEIYLYVFSSVLRPYAEVEGSEESDRLHKIENRNGAHSPYSPMHLTYFQHGVYRLPSKSTAPPQLLGRSPNRWNI
ncbi:hypothetical protein M413DRAFT_24827 [Hebeloma cylindrosporum]|uniref:F-box domain-containing protein n=1 Tax=Hebeloma cylindrosporum TaxID=76867 RepID=A0A0C3CNN0_HEBCY|nr:hypothetical protein M413DRAFT_24827 [Hebeloma cylindrosporum h7]